MELEVAQPITFDIVIDPPPAVDITTAPAEQVIVLVMVPGQTGPPGPASEGGFTHNQSSPAATWPITNTLGRYPAAVTVVIGDEVVDTDIETPDINTITVTFALPQSGRAEII
jgi:hypothetical protein